MIDTLEEFKKQHFIIYEQSILEIINNNTKVLIDDDIMSLLKKPPLDSMDLIRVKYLDLAKKNKVIIETEKLDKVLECYRKSVIKVCNELKDVRITTLSNVIKKSKLVKDTDVFKISKKEFNDLDKNLKNMFKESILSSIENAFVNKIETVFSSETSEEIKGKINTEIIKFIKGTYTKQLLENFDFKLLVKDTILGNAIKEQGERHVFTMANSRIFKQ